MLLTTHYMEEAEVLCDRLAIMDHGQILEEGTVDELVSRRFKERAVRFDAIEGLSDEQLAAMPGVSSVKHEDGEVLLYTSDVAGDDRGGAGGRPRRSASSRRTSASAGRPSRTSSST